MNPSGIFKDGKRLRDWTLKDSPAFSGRLLPEFDRRRSIKDMFSRKPVVSKSSTNGSAGAESSTALGSNSSLKPMPQGKAADGGQSEQETQQNSQASTVSQSNGNGQGGSTASPGKKRSAPAPSAKSNKRKKPVASAAAQSSSAKGQKSLRGFFKPAPSLPRNDSNVSSKTVEISSASVAPPFPDSGSNNAPVGDPAELSAGGDISSLTPADLDGGVAEQGSSTLAPPPSPPFIDPIVSKESWEKLFTKPNPPRCEDHDEPCISFTTKKPGANCGRAFWMCPRPIGPSGVKERNTQWRCRTFIWASDWNG